MPSHGPSRQRTAALAYSFTPGGWRALVQLPGQIVVATTNIGTRLTATRIMGPCTRGTVAETLAGLEAIAAGRNCASPLVRDVVTAIYLEDAAMAYQPVDDVLAACGAAGAALSASGVWRADAEAYLDWIESIASRVCRAANAGEVFEKGGPALTPEQWRFLAGVRAAFGRYAAFGR